MRQRTIFRVKCPNCTYWCKITIGDYAHKCTNPRCDHPFFTDDDLPAAVRESLWAREDEKRKHKED